MDAPHSPSFPYRRHIFWGMVVAGMLILVVAPGSTIAMRISAPFMALLSAGAGFLVGYIPLKVQSFFWARVSPGCIGWLCLITFYFLSVGVVLNLFALPFMEPLEQGTSNWALMGMTLPAGAGAAAGSYAVLRQDIAIG